MNTRTRHNELDLCDCCNKPIKEGRLLVPIQNTQDVFLCSRCFERLPMDLRRVLLYNSNNHKDFLLNISTIKALRNISPIYELNINFVLFLSNSSASKFERFSSRVAMTKAIEQYRFMGGWTIWYGFKCGKIIWPVSS